MAVIESWYNVRMEDKEESALIQKLRDFMNHDKVLSAAICLVAAGVCVPAVAERVRFDFEKGHVKCIGAGPSSIQPAYSWGACVSPLVKKLYGHGGSCITEEERDRVITWLDINTPYWPCYEFAFPDSYGRRLRRATGNGKNANDGPTTPSARGGRCTMPNKLMRRDVS